MIVAIVILSLSTIIFAVTTFRMMKRVEQQEDYINDLENSNISYNEFFTSLKTRVSESYSHMKNIDRLGSFEADDETGYVFRELKAIIEILNKGF